MGNEAYVYSAEPKAMYGKSLTLKIGISDPAADLAELVSFVLNNNFDPRIVQTDVFSYSEADKSMGNHQPSISL